MVDTGETYQSHSFKIKERKSDEKSTQIINPENMDQLLSLLMLCLSQVLFLMTIKVDPTT